MAKLAAGVTEIVEGNDTEPSVLVVIEVGTGLANSLAASLAMAEVHKDGLVEAGAGTGEGGGHKADGGDTVLEAAGVAVVGVAAPVVEAVAEPFPWYPQMTGPGVWEA